MAPVCPRPAASTAPGRVPHRLGPKNQSRKSASDERAVGYRLSQRASTDHLRSTRIRPAGQECLSPDSVWFSRTVASFTEARYKRGETRDDTGPWHSEGKGTHRVWAGWRALWSGLAGRDKEGQLRHRGRGGRMWVPGLQSGRRWDGASLPEKKGECFGLNVSKAKAPLLLGCRAPHSTHSCPQGLSSLRGRALGFTLQTHTGGGRMSAWDGGLVGQFLGYRARLVGSAPLSGQYGAARCPQAEQGHGNCTWGTVSTGAAQMWPGSRGQVTSGAAVGQHLLGKGAAQPAGSSPKAGRPPVCEVPTGRLHRQWRWQWLWAREQARPGPLARSAGEWLAAWHCDTGF